MQEKMSGTITKSLLACKHMTHLCNFENDQCID
jgi:hypothetical protein